MLIFPIRRSALTVPVRQSLIQIEESNPLE